MCRFVDKLSDYDVMYMLPTVEQHGYLGHCTDMAKGKFLKYIHDLPLNRSQLNYKVFSNTNSSGSSPFVRRIVSDYKKWVKDEWANESNINKELYRRAMEYVKG